MSIQLFERDELLLELERDEPEEEDEEEEDDDRDRERFFFSGLRRRIVSFLLSWRLRGDRLRLRERPLSFLASRERSSRRVSRRSPARSPPRSPPRPTSRPLVRSSLLTGALAGGARLLLSGERERGRSTFFSGTLVPFTYTCMTFPSI